MEKKVQEWGHALVLFHLLLLPWPFTIMQLQECYQLLHRILLPTTKYFHCEVQIGLFCPEEKWRRKQTQ
jgi:hypothetical protein